MSNNLSIEVIVVDNASKDGSVESIHSMFPSIHIHQNEKNKGFSMGVNQGASIAQGRFLFILNPDTVIQGNCIQQLANLISQDEQIAVVGPMMVSENGAQQQSFWTFPTLLNIMFSLFHLDLLNYYKNYGGKTTGDILEVDSVSGGAVLIRTSVFETLNGFDHHLFWMEDIDFCFRAKKDGFQILYTPKSKVLHHRGKSAKQDYRFTTANQLVSKIKYFKKHGSTVDQIGINLGILSISLIKLFVFIWLSPFHHHFRSKLMGYWTTIKWFFSYRTNAPLLPD